MPMKNENLTFSLDSIEFIFRHPWLIIFPFVIILSSTLAQVSSIPLYYNSSAIISFESPVKSTGVSRNELLAKLLIGENAKLIINDVWPQAKEEKNPVYFNALKARLSKSVRIWADSQDNRMLNIAFQDSNPNKAYKVVRAVIDSIIKENTRISSEQLEANLFFLNKQIEFYRNKIRTLETEESDIKDRLLQMYPQLNVKDRSSIRETLGERDFQRNIDPNLSKFIKYDNTLAQLNLLLSDALEKKGALKKQLIEITSKPISLNPEDYEDDNTVKMYSRAIQDKEIAITNLLTQDYAPEHPLITKLRGEIDSLNNLKEERIRSLMETGPTKETKGMVEIKAQIKDNESQINDLKDKISLTEKYINEVKDQFKETKISTDTFRDDISRAKDLSNDKQITSTYYSDFTKQLEEAKFKYRIATEKFGTTVKIIEEPKVPLYPLPFQKLPKFLAGLVLALGTGVGLAYIVELLNSSIKSGTELREFLQIPVLGSINRIVTPEEIKALSRRKKMLIIILIILSLAPWISIWTILKPIYKKIL